MPLQYALEVLTLWPGAKVWARRWCDVSYTPVSQDVAETNEESGVFSLVANNGEQITPWIHIHRPQGVKESYVKKALALKGTGTPHKDALGETLAIGDYVLVTDHQTSNLNVGKVIAFTDKKVRVLSYADYSVILRGSAGLAKIQPTIFSP